MAPGKLTAQAMVRIEEICEKVRRNHPQADLNLLRRAYLFSAREHKGQKRASGESYLVHPLEVANILADMRLDVVSVATGLLHDVVEDTLADTATIREYFGDEVAHLVEGLTKIAHISSVSREEQQAENVRKMLLAMVDDVRVVLVKLADRLHNMRTLEYLNLEKRRRIAQETMDIYAPIAHRLGMGKLRGELEDLAFKNLHPEDYRELTAQMEKRRAANEAFLNDVTATIQKHMEEAGVPFVRIEGRVKRLYSIWKKMGWQEIDLDQVYDLVAARKKSGAEEVAIVRLEQFYPFPEKSLRDVFASYPNATELVWTQEEAKNMGGWYFVQPRMQNLMSVCERPIYIGREPSASPATGSYSIHEMEQKQLVTESLAI